MSPEQRKKHLAYYPPQGPIPYTDTPSLQAIGDFLAALFDLSVDHLPSNQQTNPKTTYYIPSQTLLESEANKLGIRSMDDLYGGVVTDAFLQTKTISHPVFHADMSMPTGWNNELGRALKPYVLKGFSAFNAQDALWTAKGLLHHTPIRLKLALTNAGQGQWVFNTHKELISFLNQAPIQPLLEKGVVIEENLQKTTTFSVGQTEIQGHVISYLGQQHTTLNLLQEQVYGGSMLFVVKGDYDALHALLEHPNHKKILHLVRSYEDLVFKAYPKIFASRRNYDVIQGLTFHGEARTGVLEQSWRVGGASMAELLALKAFLFNPTQESVVTWTKERYFSSSADIAKAEDIYSIERVEPMTLVKYAGLLP